MTGRLRWFGHIERKDDGDWVKHCMSMKIEGTRWREHREKRDGIVSRMIRRVFLCTMRIVRIKMTG